MVAKANEYKTSKELMDIAGEMIVLLAKKYKPTWAETSIIIFLMGDCQQYANEAEHIKRMMKHGKQD